MAVAGRKCVRFYAYVVQHADDEVGQRRVLSLVVCDVASVLVVAAHQKDWQVSGVVGVCVSLVAAEQYRCVVHVAWPGLRCRTLARIIHLVPDKHGLVT